MEDNPFDPYRESSKSQQDNEPTVEELRKLLLEAHRILERDGWQVLSRTGHDHAGRVERDMMQLTTEIEKHLFRWCDLCEANVEVDAGGNCRSEQGIRLLHGGTYAYRSGR